MDIHTEDRSFLLDKVLKNLTGEFLDEDLEKIRLIRRDKILTPVIYIGTGSCGLVAGAGNPDRNKKIPGRQQHPGQDRGMRMHRVLF